MPFFFTGTADEAEVPGVAGHGRARRERCVGAVLELARRFLIVGLDLCLQGHAGGSHPRNALAGEGRGLRDQRREVLECTDRRSGRVGRDHTIIVDRVRHKTTGNLRGTRRLSARDTGQHAFTDNRDFFVFFEFFVAARVFKAIARRLVARIDHTTEHRAEGRQARHSLGIDDRFRGHRRRRERRGRRGYDEDRRETKHHHNEV